MEDIRQFLRRTKENPYKRKCSIGCRLFYGIFLWLRYKGYSKIKSSTSIYLKYYFKIRCLVG